MVRYLLLLISLNAVGSSVQAEEATEPTPTYADLSYGPHKMNVLDFWQAEGATPRPLLVYIHGGGVDRG